MRNLFLTALFSLLTIGRYPVVHAEPLDFGWLCSHQAQYPFTGIGLCDVRNVSCAAVASVFTWYAGDTSVDAGYDRARNIFAPTGWRDWANKKPELPSTYDTVSGNLSMNIEPLWGNLHREHHDAIAYAAIEGDSFVLLTQFEYLSGQIDHDGMPLAGAHPLRARYWEVMTGYTRIDGFVDDPFGRLNNIRSPRFRSPQYVYPEGSLIEDIETNENNTPPSGHQSLKQRWSCQKFHPRR